MRQVSGGMKLFLDNVQQHCFGWPVSELRWRAGGGFTTGGHVASGKEGVLRSLHSFFLAVQMVPSHTS